MSKEITNEDIESRIRILKNQIEYYEAQLVNVVLDGPSYMMPMLNDSIQNAKEMIDMYESQLRVKIGRPSIGITKRVSVTMPEGVWKDVSDHCEEHGISLAAFFRFATEQLLYEDC